jgi:hypothetical protein
MAGTRKVKTFLRTLIAKLTRAFGSGVPLSQAAEHERNADASALPAEDPARTPS